MIPSHVERARDSVLGTLLHFYVPESIVVVQAQHVTPKDFGERESRSHVLYRAILALHRDGVMVDPVTVEGFLSRHGMLERAGGVAYMELLAVSATPSSLKEHASLVAEDGRWSRLLRACGSVQRAVEARDDEALREAAAALKRDVLSGERPQLRVVKGSAA